MFADADLMGIPVRVVVSSKTVSRGVVEIAFRDKSYKADAAIADAPEMIKNIIADELKKLEPPL